MGLTRLAFGPVVAACCGCAADLLPGELVVPGELPSSQHLGSSDSALGASVAVEGGKLLAGAPGSGQVRRLDGEATSQGAEGLGRWVWWTQGVAHAAASSDGVYRVDGVEASFLWEAPGAISYAAGETSQGERVAATTGLGVQLWDGEGQLLSRLELGGVERLAMGWERLLLQVCQGDACEVLAWSFVTSDTTLLGPSGRGGGLVEVGGVAWWGDPQLEDEQGRGVVRSEDGDELEGIEGDHLGRSLCPGYAAGVFNTIAVPARLRLVPLAGGSVISVDQAPPGRAPTLACGDDLLMVGLPKDGLHQWGEGRVLVVETAAP